MICIPIIEHDTKSALEKISEAKEHTDVLEFRLDLMDSFDLHAMISAAEKPVIVTYRSKREGGQGEHDPLAVADYLIRAAHANAAYIDVELNMPVILRNKIIDNRRNSRIIISTHIMDHTPPMDDLRVLLDESVRAGGDIVKIVTMANSIEENLRVLELVSEAKKRKIDIIAFCMGPLGRMSRVFSPLMGGYLTFASLEEGEESAAGQIPVQEMKRLLEFFAV
ncbi:MAG: type I 3-dehydroquinate dehydratase [Deltaproteobacteria bacterium]|nr:type I 3-dehydroquinate dehydratase [Deltaproteobacteria bacterium]